VFCDFSVRLGLTVGCLLSICRPWQVDPGGTRGTNRGGTRRRRRGQPKDIRGSDVSVVEKADVDWSRPVEERVEFDRDTLGRLIRLYKKSGGSEKTKMAYRRPHEAAGARLHEAGEDNPHDAMTPMLVLIRLKERLTGSADKRYEETPDGPRLRAEPLGRRTTPFARISPGSRSPASTDLAGGSHLPHLRWPRPSGRRAHQRPGRGSPSRRQSARLEATGSTYERAPPLIRTLPAW